MDSKLIFHHSNYLRHVGPTTSLEPHLQVFPTNCQKTLTTISDFTFTFYSTLFARPLNLGTAFETYSVTTSALTPWTSRTTRLEGLTYLAEENRLD